MIKKKKEDYQFVEGVGRPFDMNPRRAIERTTPERQKPVIIHLAELNGQDGNPRVPKNFHPKRGRTLDSFCNPAEYDEDDEYGYGERFDVE